MGAHADATQLPRRHVVREGMAAVTLPRLYEAEEVALALKISAWWLKSEARKGRIPAVKTGSGWRWSEEQCRQIVASLSQEATGPSQSTNPQRKPRSAATTGSEARTVLTPRVPPRLRAAG